MTSVLIFTVHVTRDFTKSNKFRETSVRCSCGSRKASMQLTAELQYYFRRACLPFSQNDTSLSADLSLPTVYVFVLHGRFLLYRNMVHKHRTGSYLRTVHIKKNLLLSDELRGIAMQRAADSPCCVCGTSVIYPQIVHALCADSLCSVHRSSMLSAHISV